MRVHGKSKGIALAYLTAVVSGISVFANCFGVVTLDSTAYAFLKNVLVAPYSRQSAFRSEAGASSCRLSRKQLLMLAFIGVVGGGAAFALYFAGLASTGARTARSSTGCCSCSPQ